MASTDNIHRYLDEAFADIPRTPETADLKEEIRGNLQSRVSELEAHIDVFEPPRRLRLIYLPAAQLPPANSVMIDDFILETVKGGTIVRLLGSGVPAGGQWDTQYWRLRTSWQAAMTRLKVYVEKQLNPGAAS